MADAKDRLAADNIDHAEKSGEAIYLRNEAVDTLLKLDECRLVLNKFMGPNGPLRPSERHKFLPNQGEGDFTVDEPRGLAHQQSKKYLPPLATKTAALQRARSSQNGFGAPGKSQRAV